MALTITTRTLMSQIACTPANYVTGVVNKQIKSGQKKNNRNDNGSAMYIL